jgi:uncharacterized protein
MNTSNKLDLTPWYRQPWPWILMAGPAFVVVAGSVMAWIAFSGQDGLVVDDYYRQGLAINQVLARDARAAQLGLSGDVQLSGNSIEVRISSAAPLPKQVRLALVHPTMSGMDQVVFAPEISPGRYAAPLKALLPSHWRILAEGGDWRLVTEIDTRKERSARFGAGRP